MAAWQDTADKLTAAGMSQEDVQSVALGVANKMSAQGNDAEDFENFFGKPKEPDPGLLSAHFDQQLKRNLPVGGAVEQAPDTNTLGTAFKAAWENSLPGMGARRKMPETSLEEPSIFFDGASATNRFVQGAAQTALDFPVMAVGALAGAPLGPTGAAAGAFALPQAMRDALIQNYKQGGISSVKDFADMADAAFIGAVKGGATGLVTGAAGGLAKAATVAAPAFIQTLAPIAGEAVAMPSFSGAMEGKLPEKKDFLDAALQIGGLHGFGSLKDKAMGVFKETGLGPHDLGAAAMNDPVIQQEMLGNGIKGTPPSLEHLKEPDIKSDFVVVDGKLIPADKAPPQADMALGRSNIVDFTNDARERFSPDAMREAARAHDPEAFKQLENQSKMVKGGLASIKENNEHLNNLKVHEDRVSELADVREKLSDPEKYGVADKESHSALLEREAELKKTESKDNARSNFADHLRQQNEETLNQIKKIRDGSTLKDRLAKAHEKARDTLVANMKDRLMNKAIELPNHPDTELHADFNPEFNDPKDSVPQLTDEAKNELLDPEQLDLFTGVGDHIHTQDGAMANILKDHPELAKEIAPDLVQELENPDTGETTLKVGPGGKPKPEKTTWKNILRDRYNDLIYSKRAAEDTEKLIGSKLPTDVNPFHRQLAARASDKLAQLMLGNKKTIKSDLTGIFDKAGNKISDPLDKILSDHVAPEDYEDFRKYLLYKHGIDENATGRSEPGEAGSIEGGGKLTGINDVEARAFVEKNKEKFDEAQKKFTNYNNALLQYAVDGDLITQEQRDSLVEKYPNYVPFQRLTEEMAKKSSGYKKEIFQKRKGSELPFLDPIAATIEKTQNVVREVEENKAKLSMMKMNDLRGSENSLLKPVESPKETLDLDKQELQPDGTFSKNMDARKNLGDAEMGYFDKGVYKVAEFHDPELAKTMKIMRYDAGVAQTLVSFLKPFAQISRFGASSGADFFVRHVLRSEGFTSIISDKNRIPLVSTLANIPEVLKGNSDAYIEAQKSGAFNGVMADINGLLKSRNYVMRDKEGALSTSFNVVKNTFSAVHTAMRVMEEAKLLSIYKDQTKELPENASMADKLQAGWNTSRTSVNGLQVGAKMNGINSIVAFMHYDLQGAGRGYEAALENPVQFATRAAFISGISAMLWYSHHDDDDYNNKPNYEKNTFWHVKVGDEYVKIAKPWELGVLFGSLPERMLDAEVNHDPRALKSIGESLASLIPLHLPSAYDQYEALHQNTNTLTDRKIISDQQLKVAPAEQRASYTSNVAIGLAKAIGYVPGAGKLHLDSPIMVDHAINMWLGQPGRLATQGVDFALQKAGIAEPDNKPAWELADYPFIGGFMSRHATYNAEPLKEFHDEFSALQIKADTLKLYQEAGRTDEASAYMEKNPELANFKNLESANKMIGTVNKNIQKTLKLPSDQMGAKDKKQVIEDMGRQMIDTAKQKLDELNEARNNK